MSSRTIVSHGLGMIQYPVGTCPSSDMDDHVMGVVALAWCTDDAVARWGESWARHGSIEMRFRSHLTTGLDLSIATVDHFDQQSDPQSGHQAAQSDVTISGTRPAPMGADAVYTSGSLRPGPTAPPLLGSRTPTDPFPVPPERKLLHDYVLHPVEFDHVAARDLRLAEHLQHGALWLERGWAHPAWLASAANAIVRHNVDFEHGGYWLHAGVAVDLHEPVADGAHLTASGRVVELFERSTHRYMVCDVSIDADGTRRVDPHDIGLRRRVTPGVRPQL